MGMNLNYFEKKEPENVPQEKFKLFRTCPHQEGFSQMCPPLITPLSHRPIPIADSLQARTPLLLNLSSLVPHLHSNPIRFQQPEYNVRRVAVTSCGIKENSGVIFRGCRSNNVRL